jgi:hypothetical protein
MTTCQPAKTPLDLSLPLLKARSNDKHTDILRYQEIVGSLNHLVVYSRSDIAFAVSKFLNDPTETYMSDARVVLSYLKYFIWAVGVDEQWRFEQRLLLHVLHPFPLFKITLFSGKTHLFVASSFSRFRY